MKIKNRRWVAFVFSGCVFMGALIFSGCVQHVVYKPHLPRITTSRGRDGIVTVSWPSLAGYRYQLSAQRWDIESGVEQNYGEAIMGTGEIIELKFATDPNQPVPAFILSAEKVDE